MHTLSGHGGHERACPPATRHRWHPPPARLRCDFLLALKLSSALVPDRWNNPYACWHTPSRTFPLPREQLPPAWGRRARGGRSHAGSAAGGASSCGRAAAAMGGDGEGQEIEVSTLEGASGRWNGTTTAAVGLIAFIYGTTRE